MKIIVTFMVVMLMILMYIPVYADNSNLVRNSGFEQGSPDKWEKSAWDKTEGATQFLIDDTVSHSGSKSACIINNSSNDSRYKQEISVKSNSYYKLSCWIKTENVGTDNKGANLSVEGILDISRQITGTSSNWEYVELYGKTDKKQKNISVTVGVGGYSSTNTGKAWFDDVLVEKLDKLPRGVNAVNLYVDNTPSTPSKNDGPKTNDFSAMYPYTVAFFIIGLFLFITIKKGILKIKPGRVKAYLFILLGIGLVIRIVIAPLIEGYPNDIGLFKWWGAEAAKSIPLFYSNIGFCDYPPLYIYILAVISNIVNFFNLTNNPAAYLIMIKLPSMLTDIVTAYLLYRLASKQLKPSMALLLSGLYAFNPAVLFDSAIWGQVDSFLTMLILFTLVLLKSERKPLASAVFAVAVLLKPQALIFLPVLGYELLVDLIKRRNFKNVILSVVYGIATAFIIILPFSYNKTSLIENPFWIFKLYAQTAGGYKNISLNAYNLYSMIGKNLHQDSDILLNLGFHNLTFGELSYILVIVISLFSGYLFLKSKNSSVLFAASLVQITGFFVLWTRMHERYMFPAIALALVCYIYLKDIRFMALFGGLTFTIFMNAQDVLLRRFVTPDYPHIPSDDITLRVISFVNVVLLAFTIFIAIETIIRKKTFDLNFVKRSENNKQKTVTKQTGIK